jgi:hypothetical protein
LEDLVVEVVEVQVVLDPLVVLEEQMVEVDLVVQQAILSLQQIGLVLTTLEVEAVLEAVVIQLLETLMAAQVVTELLSLNTQCNRRK